MSSLKADSVTGPDSFTNRVDDGLFGPDSVTWRLYLDPSARIGMVAAVLLQALNPNMMRLFDNASSNKIDPEQRAALTGQYVMTTTFGDTPHADAAGAAVRRMHEHAVWTDPQTGETLRADEPKWLEWTHNTLVWGVLRASEVYGPALTPAERQTFIREQFKSAELVGIDPGQLPASEAELDAYINDASAWLACTLPAAESAKGLRQSPFGGNPVKRIPATVVQDGILALLPGWALSLYGLDQHPHRRAAARHALGVMLSVSRRVSPSKSLVLSTIADVDAHPFRRLRSDNTSAE